MHDTAYQIGGLVIQTYLPAGPAKILEIGAQNVNGTLRDHAPRHAQYTGLDFEGGEGVDIVVTGLSDWNVPDDHFDLVMASSVFEHDKAFWRTFLAMCAKTKPGGHIYISAPSNGTVHRYPQDYWRFYPDCSLAFEEWARDEGFEISLVESFVAERISEVWNDFCAVFRREPSKADLNRDFVHEKVRATNILTWRSPTIINPVEDSEDTRLLRAAQEETQKWVRHGEHLNALHAQDMKLRTRQIADLMQEIVQQSERLAALDEASGTKDEELAQLHDRAEELAKELEKVREDAQAEARDRQQAMRQLEARSDELRSRLAQREEEAAQAWATAEDRASERDALAVQAEKVRKDLVEANGWVERLALNRTLMERQVAKLEKSLAALSGHLERVQQRNGVLTERLAELSAKNDRSHQDEELKEAYEAAVAALDDKRTEVEALRTELGDAKQAADTSELERAYATTRAELADSRKRLSKAMVELADTRRSSSASMRAPQAALEPAVDLRRLEECQLRLQETETQLAQSHSRLEENEREFVALGELLAATQDRLEQLTHQNEWLRKAGVALLDGGKWWWRFMPLAWRNERRNRRLSNQGLFDSEAYTSRYPDVADSGQEPLRHFIHHGIAENRRYD